MDDESAYARHAAAIYAEATWHESAIEQEMRRQLEEYPAIIDRYYANPCPETFAPLREMHEQQRQKVAQAEQQPGKLRQMVSSLQARIQRVQQSVADAQAIEDGETAEKRTREHKGLEELLLSVQETLQQAEDTLAAAQEAFARAEAHMAREAARLAGSDS
ncbi:MAG: hypothetical protein V4671_00375 [Armatimonadota bacterium]